MTKLILPVIIFFVVAGVGAYWFSISETVDEHGMTPLMRAAAAGDEAEVRRLLNSGARVNKRVPSNALQVLIAVLSWFQEVPHRDVGWSALMYATGGLDPYAKSGGNPEIMRILIRAGADVNVAGSLGETALSLSVIKSNLESVGLLITSGADVNVRRDITGLMPLMVAATSNDTEIMKSLIRSGADVDAAAKDGSTALIMATKRGKLESALTLLEAGAHVDARDSNGWTALQWASTEGHVEIAKLLEEEGASMAVLNDSELIKAVMAQNMTAVQEALFNGANPNARDYTGKPILISAASRGNPEIVQALIGAGADINTKDSLSWTPLYAAAMRGHTQVVKLLLDTNGIQVTGADLAVAAGGGNMVPHGGKAEIVQMLIDAGADVNWGDGEALRNAAWSGNAEIVKMLLTAGANPNLKDRSDMTPLSRAKGMGHSEVVEILVAAGAKE